MNNYKMIFLQKWLKCNWILIKSRNKISNQKGKILKFNIKIQLGKINYSYKKIKRKNNQNKLWELINN